LSNEAIVEVLVKELSEGCQLDLRKGVDGIRRQSHPILEVDLEIVWPMGC
jgi:hypothetical protein